MAMSILAALKTYSKRDKGNVRPFGGCDQPNGILNIIET
jgi:hypothetical protein